MSNLFQRLAFTLSSSTFIDEIQSSRFSNVFMFNLLISIRMGEMLALSWDYIDFEKGIRMTLELYTHLSKERENIKRIQLVEFLDGWLKKEVTDISFFDPESNVIDFSRHQKKTS